MATVVVLMLILLIMVFPLADMFRSEVSFSALEDSWETLINLRLEIATTMDFDAYQQLMNATVFVEKEGHTMGHQIGTSLLFWVPRSIWHAKALPSGELVADFMGYSYTNLSMPLWGEAYLDGGLPGVLALFFMYGIFCRRMDNYFIVEEKYRALRMRTVFVALFAAYQIFFLRGSLLPATAYLVPAVAMIVLMHIFKKMPSVRVLAVRRFHKGENLLTEVE
jgi:hypothetical protein